MTREDMLKELELWPLWTLKHSLPSSNSAPERATTLVQDHLENAAPMLDIVEAPNRLKAYESEGGRCLMLLAAQDFTQEEETLWANMCKAMRIEATRIQTDWYLKDLFTTRHPAVLILFGEEAAQTVLASDKSVEELRGEQHFYETFPCIVTLDLKHLLQYLPDKAKAWDDLRAALTLMAN